MPEFDNPFMPEESNDDEEPTPDLKHFPYFDIYKVRNMYFAVDIPVFTALKDQDVEDGYYRFKHIYCCN